MKVKTFSLLLVMNFDTLIAEYQQLETLLNKYKQAGKIENVVTINDFVIPYDEQNRRLAKWNAFGLRIGKRRWI